MCKCTTQTFFKTFSSTIGELMKGEDTEKRKKKEVNSKTRWKRIYRVPLSHPVARHNGESRISAESRVRLSIYLLVRVRTHAHTYVRTKMHVTSGYDRRSVDERAVHGLPWTLISVGSSPSIEGKLILSRRERERMKPSGSERSRIIANNPRGARESRSELGTSSSATSILSIVRLHSAGLVKSPAAAIDSHRHGWAKYCTLKICI